QKEIGDFIGVSNTTIFSWMNEYKITSRMRSKIISSDLLKPSKEKLCQMYLDEKMSCRKIASNIGVGCDIINKLMKTYGIELRANSISVKPSREYLEKMYHNEKMSFSDIADIVGVSRSTVSRWIHGYKIESRTVSESKKGRTGENSGGWRGGVSGGKYCYKFNDTFKEAVRERDDYTCQLCGFEQNGRKLDIHHIHYDKPNCWPDVVALCRSCNSKVNSNRDYWEKFFEDDLIMRGLYCWSLSQEN
ncbi:helix-turn-helix domain-containing protein, partial [Patescibacteria group bacterium]|nr:helix-turn-helix domain-containing protein [Patescibacteria group bacterium]